MALLCSLQVDAQADGLFKVYDNAFLNETNNKGFVVISAEGKSSSELKNSVISILSTLFDHPDKVITTVGDNIIMVNAHDANGFSESGINEYGDAYTNSYTYSYSLKIETKDGRLRINSPSFSKLIGTFHFLGKDRPLGIFGEEEFYKQLKKCKAETKVENLINTYINKLVEGLANNDDW